MITVLAIVLLIIVGALFVMMAVTPMVAEAARRSAPTPKSLVSLERPVPASSRRDNHQHAA